MTAPKAQHSGEYVSLREYIEIQLLARDNATSAAYEAMNRRMDAANELRGALSDLSKSAVTQKEFATIKDDIRSLRESRAELSGKASQEALNKTSTVAMLSLSISLIGLVLSIFQLAGIIK